MLFGKPIHLHHCPSCNQQWTCKDGECQLQGSGHVCAWQVAGKDGNDAAKKTEAHL